MVVYIDKNEVPELEAGIIPDAVFRYVIEKAENAQKRYFDLYRRYKGEYKKNHKADEVCVTANYAKYVVDIIKGYYLGDPIKYDNNSKPEKKEHSAFGEWSVQAKLDKDGSVVRHTAKSSVSKHEIDISAIVDAFSHQNINAIDDKVGKHNGIFGEACEVLYASSDEIPEPRSAVYFPYQCVLVQDNTVEHKDLFALVIDKRERVNKQEYYAVTLLTDKTEQDYHSTDLKSFSFHPEGPAREHFFGKVPVIVYENNDEKQGDFEQAISLIDARNDFLSDRLTDKKKFVRALLAMFGITLADGTVRMLADEQFLDGLPTDARIEYIQKVFDEASMKVLDDTLINDIHKVTMAIDLSDEQFAGDSTGIALKMKLFCMTSLVKSKMRRMETGLKKRFALYNNWLSFKGAMPEVSVDDIDIVYTISIPVNEQEVVNTVKSLQGIVDDQTLLSLLWFIHDPAEALENIKKQKEEEQKQYMDSFGMQKNEQSFLDEKEPPEKVNGFEKR